VDGGADGRVEVATAAHLMPPVSHSAKGRWIRRKRGPASHRITVRALGILLATYLAGAT
jgi:hypothetical protein